MAEADPLKGAGRNPGNFAAVPELDANANAFRTEVNDEVLASITYEPDMYL